LVVIDGEKRSESFMSSDWKRLGEEVGYVLESRKMHDAKLPLSNTITNPVKSHV
jgi:hypothetical protein